MGLGEAEEMRMEKALRPLVETTWRFHVLAGVLVAIIGWALYAYSVQLSTGLGVTGMNAPAYWGIYIVNFVYLIGLSAGGVIVASLAYVFNLKEYRPIARIAELLAIACLVLAVIFVALDVGRPERLLNIVLFGNPWSPLVWDFIVISAYLAICLVYGYLGTRPDIVAAMKAIPKRAGLYRLLALGYTDVSPGALQRDHRTLRLVAFAALPTAIALHSVTAWILGLMKAQPGWHTALLAPLFVVSAVVSGLALVVVTTVAIRTFLHVDIEDALITKLGRFLVWLIPMDFYFAFAELITIQYGRLPAEFTTLQDITLGPLAWAFWAEMIIGLLIPFLLIVRPKSRTPRRVGIAAFLVFIGVFFKRIDIVIPSLIFRWLPFPGGSYSPTWVELSLMAGVYAFGILVILILAKLFPLVPLEAQGEGVEAVHEEAVPQPDEPKGRGDLVALLAVALRPPSDPQEFRRCLDALLERGGPGDGELAEAIRRLREEPRPEREYHRLFLGPMRPIAPPFESVYREGVSQGASTAAFLRELAEAGLEPVPGFRLPPDHIAVELEYLAILVSRAEAAASAGQRNEADTWAERARAFVDEHLARWLPAFLARLESSEPQTPYATLVRWAMGAAGVPVPPKSSGGA